MTTIEPSTAPATEAAADVPISAVAPHPDNVRQHLGDLTELVRSIKSHGVLQPLLVLPANDKGVHLVVAGHRRLAAATRAGVERVPIVVRDLDRAAVIEAMLIENGHRSDLNVREEVDAIATLISIDTGVTPTKLSKRIGKSQRWVRDRMAITVLPTPLARQAQRRRPHPRPGRRRRRLRRPRPRPRRGRLRRTGRQRPVGPRPDPHRRALPATRSSSTPTRPQRSPSARRARSPTSPRTTRRPTRPAASLRSASTSGPTVASRATPCTSAATRGRTGSARPPTAPHPSGTDRPVPHATSTDAARAEQDRHDDPHVKRRARLARLAAGTELFARRRGGPTSSELMVLALHSYIDHASHDAAKFAATMLGLDTDRPFQALAAHAATGAAGLAQAAGAIACGTAEVEAYHSTRHGVLAWYGLLTDHGWEPDDWTAARLALAAERQADDPTRRPTTATRSMTQADDDDDADIDDRTDGDRRGSSGTSPVPMVLPAMRAGQHHRAGRT